MVGGADMDFWEMMERYGSRAAVEWLRETYAMRRELVRVIKKHELDVDLDPCGSLMFACREQDLPVLEREARVRRKYGFRSSLLRGRALRNVAGVQALAGLFVPEDTLVTHSKLVLAFAELVSKRIRVFERTPVRSLRKQKGMYILKTPNGRVCAKRVVIAASVASSLLATELPTPPKSTTYSALTRRLTAVEFRRLGLRTAHVLWGMGTEYSMMRLMPDRRVLITGDHPSGLAPFLYRLFPSLTQVTIERTWSGEVDTPKDSRPLVGHRGNLFYSYGLTSHGLIHAFLNGKKIVKLMG
jgi:glycine/D-amino acid oxidase-like deaminating enzyme